MNRTDRIAATLAVSLMTMTACSGPTDPGPAGPGDPVGAPARQDPTPSPAPMGTPDADHTILVGPADAPLFEPSTLTIKLGQTVRWDFMGEGHSVISGADGVADGKFCAPNNQDCAQAPAQLAGSVYVLAPTRAGTYSYFCSLHVAEGMSGTITVVP